MKQFNQKITNLNNRTASLIQTPNNTTNDDCNRKEVILQIEMVDCAVRDLLGFDWPKKLPEITGNRAIDAINRARYAIDNRK